MSKVVIVDKNDNVVGSEDKETAFKNGLIRRIVRIFVFKRQRPAIRSGHNSFIFGPVRPAK